MMFQEWCNKHRELQERCQRFRQQRNELVAKITKRIFGFSVRGNCLHNAAIDTDFSGWMYGKNRRDLREVRRANELENDWTFNQIADRLSRKWWAQVKR